MSGLRKMTYCAAAIVVVAALAILIVFLQPALRPVSATQSDNPSAHKNAHRFAFSRRNRNAVRPGRADSIVGVTDYCDYPPEAKRIESVGGFGKPNLEKLLALSPDLVVGAGLERSDVLQAVQKAGVRVLKISIDNIDEMFQALRQVGDAVGKRRQADEAVASMQAELQKIASRSDNSERTSRPRVFVELWDDPLTTVGRASFLDDVIARAGGVNVAHELAQPHLRISAEKVIEWNPDAIVVAHMSRRASSASQIAHRIGWSDIAAVKRGNVFCDIPSELILRPGPRLVEGVKVLAERLRKVAVENNSGANAIDRKHP